MYATIRSYLNRNSRAEILRQGSWKKYKQLFMKLIACNEQPTLADLFCLETFLDAPFSEFILKTKNRVETFLETSFSVTYSSSPLV